MVVLTSLSLCLSSQTAHAEFLDTTQSLQAGNLGLAGEFEAGLTDNSPLLLRLHQAVGLAGGVDLYLREGLFLGGSHAFLVAGGAKWTFLSESAHRPGLALWIGGHYRTSGLAGADVQALIDKRFGRLTPFAGSHFWLDFGQGQSRANLRLIGGLRVAINSKVAWLVEAGLGLLGDPRPHFVSTGPRIAL